MTTRNVCSVSSFVQQNISNKIHPNQSTPSYKIHITKSIIIIIIINEKLPYSSIKNINHHHHHSHLPNHNHHQSTKITMPIIQNNNKKSYIKNKKQRHPHEVDPNKKPKVDRRIGGRVYPNQKPKAST